MLSQLIATFDYVIPDYNSNKDLISKPVTDLTTPVTDREEDSDGDDNDDKQKSIKYSLSKPVCYGDSIYNFNIKYYYYPCTF